MCIEQTLREDAERALEALKKQFLTLNLGVLEELGMNHSVLGESGKSYVQRPFFLMGSR